MTELADLVDAFKREVSPPGSFVADFPLVTDTEVEASLADAFAEAQLDGFFSNYVLDVDSSLVEPDISVAGAALVVIYAGMRLIRQRMTSLGSRKRFVAGPVEYEVQAQATVLTELLKELRERRDRLLRGAGGPKVFQMDGYATRGLFCVPGGFYGGEVP